jgi:isoquinoline 1-oxidoreductase alpha subunit
MSERDERTWELVVDGEPREIEAEGEMPLLWALRDRLGLLGPKFGCGTGLCGACTVLEGERAVRSCVTTLADAAGRSFTTIEGLSPDGSHPVQRAWLEEDVAQCGFCQGGMILETVALLAEKPEPTDEEIDVALHDVLCRCGSYARVRKAVRTAARNLKDGR